MRLRCKYRRLLGALLGLLTLLWGLGVASAAPKVGRDRLELAASARPRLRSLHLVEHGFQAGFSDLAEKLRQDLHAVERGKAQSDALLRTLRTKLARWKDGVITHERIELVMKRVLRRASRNGKLDVERLGLELGPRAHALALDLEHRGLELKFGERNMRLTGDNGFDKIGRAKFAVGDETMEALAALAHRAEKTKPLAGYRVIGVQHLLGDTEKLVDALQMAGVEYKDMTMTGKVYSTHLLVGASLRQKGVRVPPLLSSNGTGGLRPEDVKAHLLKSVRADLEAVRNDPGAKLLLIDDGGVLIRLVHEEYPDLVGRVRAVEQTTRGIVELEGMKLKFPVVNVARSDAKLTYETPSIGRAVGRVMATRLRLVTGQVGLKPKELLLVGYGAVNTHTAKYLAEDGRKAGYKVKIYDKSPEARARAKADGFEVYETLEEGLPNAEVLLSATGRTGLSLEQAHLLPDNAIVASAGSLTHEIDRRLLSQHESPDLHQPMKEDAHYEDRFAGKKVRLAGRNAELLDRVALMPSGKRLMVLGGGYPINFLFDPKFGAGSSVMPASHAQLTVGLLFLAALQAVNTHEPGLPSLDEAAQKELIAGVQAQLARTGESLLTPTF